MDKITFVYFLVGFIIVFIFSINYFNQPSYKFVDQDKTLANDDSDILLEPALPKYLTDRFEYNFYLSAYVLVSEVVFIMLVLFLPDLINDESSRMIDGLISFTPSKENIVLAALIITGIAPNLPYISDLLERSKLYLHRQAQIPRKGQEVYRKIKGYSPRYSSTVIEKIVKDQRFQNHSISNNGFVRTDINESDFGAGKWTLEGRWAKLSYLLYFVESWSHKQPFISYIGNPELKHSSIENSYDLLQRLMAEHKAGNISGADAANLNSRLEATLHRTYRLISCLLYLAARTDTAVDAYLDELGYDSSERLVFPIPWKTVVFISAAVVFSIIIGIVLTLIISEYILNPTHNNIGTGSVTSWIGYGTPFIVMPVLVVLVLKRYLSTRSETWPVVTETKRYEKFVDRPWHIYFLVSLFAYLVGVIVLYSLSITASLLQQIEFDYFVKLRVAIAWSFVVFVTAVFVAFRLDSPPNLPSNKIYYYILRSIGAVTQGLVTASIVNFIYIHTHDLPLNLISSIPDHDKSMLLVFSIIGFLLGLLINIAIGLGRLRQRRKFGRRFTKRKLVLISDGVLANSNTINVSKHGALLRTDKKVLSSSNNDTSDEVTVSMSDENGESVKAHVVNVRGDQIHLKFANSNDWASLKKKLGIAINV